MATSVTPRVFELLAEARRALALRGRLRAAGRDASAVDDALETLYRDLGHAVVHAAETHDGLVFPTIRRLDVSDFELDDDSTESWYSDERTPRPRPLVPEPLFDPGEIDGPTDVPVSDFDEATPVLPVEREVTRAAAPDYAVRRLDDAPVPTDGHPRVGEMLVLLARPASLSDPDELKVELARLQWATSELASRLDGLPDEVRTAVVALVAARVRDLRGRVDNDVALRIVIDRLQRYRIDAGLPAVAALLPTPLPERGSWSADAQGWWERLTGAT